MPPISYQKVFYAHVRRCFRRSGKDKLWWKHFCCIYTWHMSHDMTWVREGTGGLILSVSCILQIIWRDLESYCDTRFKTAETCSCARRPPSRSEEEQIESSKWKQRCLMKKRNTCKSGDTLTTSAVVATEIKLPKVGERPPQGFSLRPNTRGENLFLVT